MAYDDEQARRSRVVVETPTSRREVTQTESYRDPERGGISGATVGVIVVLAIALITVVVLFLMNGQQTTADNNNLAAQQAQQAQQPPVMVQQPAPAAQQPPVIIQQPAPAAQQPVVITQPAPGGGEVVNTSNDGAVQTAIDKKISDDPALSTLGITATVLDGKVTLTGTVASETLKTQIDRTIRAVKGVKQVDNQLVVSAA
jgi:osmotically-inducible protein OsmY